MIFTNYSNKSQRNEMHILLYGSETTKPYGHWIRYRRYNNNQISQYWDVETQTTKDGPKYTFTEEHFRVINNPSYVVEGENLSNALAILKEADSIYGVPYNMHPKTGDLILELVLSRTFEKPKGTERVLDAFIIEKSIPIHGENNQVEYYLLGVKSKQIGD